MRSVLNDSILTLIVCTGAAYCLLFGKYIEVGTVRNRWVVKGSFKRWWQVKLWEKFFDDMDWQNLAYSRVHEIFVLFRDH